MRSFPLIARELRVQSRKRQTYLSRSLWGLAALGMLALLLLSSPYFSNDGRAVFSVIHGALAVMLLIMAPIASADSISREKREGTLGLLMLTPLKPRQVATGKFAAHLLRLFYFTLMMLPFITIPALIGGVEFQDFLLSAIVLFSILIIGMSAGFLASAISVSFGVALVWSIMHAAIALWAISTIVINGALLSLPSSFVDDIPVFIRLVVVGPGLLLVPIQAREIAGQIPVPSAWFIPALEAGLAVAALMFLGISLAICARRIAQHSIVNIESKRGAEFRKKFLTPVLFKPFLRRFMARQLDRNPLIWLEYRTAWARSARWALLLVIIIVETYLLMDLPRREDFLDLHFAMLCGILGFMTLKSCGSFQREKESGAFELLLVSPFTEAKLLFGRLRAVASYFGPAVALLGIFGLVGRTWTESWGYYNPPRLSEWIAVVSICAALLSAPTVGLFFALRCHNFLPALLWTGGLTIVGPICAWVAFEGTVWLAASRLDWWIALVLRDNFQSVWWPWLTVAVLYHAAVINFSTRATLELLRSRRFAI